MAVLLKEMQDLKDQVIEDYYKKAVSTNQFMGRNFEMALRLQRQWRMQKIRKKYLDTRKAAVTIQRHIRMYLGLKRVQDLKFVRQDEWNMKFFDFHAVLIQKVYFGYMSRKYIHSFYARQENLARTAKEEEKVRKMMQEYLRDLENTKKTEELGNQQQHFKKLAGDLHHLLSTKTIPGIYNPPYAKKPTAFEVEVESHLKTIFKEKYSSGTYLRQKARLPDLPAHGSKIPYHDAQYAALTPDKTLARVRTPPSTDSRNRCLSCADKPSKACGANERLTASRFRPQRHRTLRWIGWFDASVLTTFAPTDYQPTKGCFQ